MVKVFKVISQHDWVLGSSVPWVTTNPSSDVAGGSLVGVVFDTANPGAKRSGYLRLENATTHEIAIAIIEQEG